MDIYKQTEKDMKSGVIHECLHFIYFEKWQKIMIWCVSLFKYIMGIKSPNIVNVQKNGHVSQKMDKELMEIFFNEPKKKFNTREIARILSISPTTATNLLKNLVIKKVIFGTAERNMNLYKANTGGDKEFDRLRYARNSINYYGVKIDFEQGKKLIEKIFRMRKTIIEKYLDGVN